MRAGLALVLVSAVAMGIGWRASGFESAPQSSPAPALHTIGTWVSIGPAPLVRIEGPSEPEFSNSGRVAAIAVDPGDARHWLIGVGNGGVWETRDAGASWTPIAEEAPTLAIGAIAFAPGNPQVIYVGTGESAAIGFARAGVSCSSPPTAAATGRSSARPASRGRP